MSQIKNAGEVPGKEVSRPAANLSAHAIGREQELEQLHQQLQRETRPLVITGVGGLGKTTFAQLYWQRHKADYQHLVWVSANAIYSAEGDRRYDNADYFVRAFTDNQLLRRNLQPQFDPQQRPVEHFREVVYRLAELPGENLLVIDNAPEAAAAYVEDLSQLQQWRILLTSRDAIQNMAAFRLDALSPEEAAALFQRIYEAEADVAALAPILSDIGHHTLTIELLAAYAREKKLTMPSLHQLMRKKGLTHLDDYEVSTPRSHKMQDIAAHLRDVFLLELNPAEQEILRYCAILPTSNMPLDPKLASEDFLCMLFDKENVENDFKKCLRRLARMNWLVEKDGGYRCHPVVAETAKEQLRPDVVNCGKLVERIIDFLSPDEETHEPIIKRARFAPLGDSVFENVIKKDGEFDKTDKNAAELAIKLAYLYSGLGKIYKALEYNKWVVDIFEKTLPPEHPDLAMSYSDIAIAYGALGEYQKDLFYSQKSLAIREKILPSDHLALATGYNNLAAAFGSLNDHQQSLVYNQKALFIFEKKLPLNHPDVAAAYNNLAVTYGGIGDNNREFEYYLKALDIWEKILPPEHPDLAISYNNIASWYETVGLHEQSLIYHQKTLTIREKLLPPEHPDLATSYINLAKIFNALGNYQKSLDYNQKALAIREIILPPEHSDLAILYINLAGTYGSLNEHQQYLVYNQKALAILEKKLPLGHPDLAELYYILAASYGKLGEHQQRLVYLQKTLIIWEKILSLEHPDLAELYSNLSITYYELGDIDRSVSFIHLAIAIQEKSFPEGHQKIVNSKNNLAFLEEKLKQSKQG